MDKRISWKKRFKSCLLWLSISMLVVMFDYLSKYEARLLLKTHAIHAYNSYLNFILIFNKGIAFGFLNTVSGWRMISFVIAVSMLVLIMLITVCKSKRWLINLALSLIIGGAIGNMLEKIVTGKVTDFIQLHYAGMYTSIFNIADLAIFTGFVLFCLSLLLYFLLWVCGLNNN